MDNAQPPLPNQASKQQPAAEKKQTSNSLWLHTIRKFLGGVLATVLAGTIVYVFITNPQKVKGKSTLEAWNSLLQYEDIYDENIIIVTCTNPLKTIEDMLQYKSDLSHQLQMTADNFKNIREEGNVDNRLFAVINLKVDTYNQTKALTELYLDSIINLYTSPGSIFALLSERQQTDSITTIMKSFIKIRKRLFDRDSSTINHVLNELTDTYNGTFFKYKFGKQIPGEEKRRERNIIGKWWFYGGGSLNIYADKTASSVDETSYKRRYDWKIEDDKLILTKTQRDSVFTYNIVRITGRAMRLAVNSDLEVIAYKK